MPTTPKIKWSNFSVNKGELLSFLLTGHLGCGLLIWFVHSPGLGLWTVLPVINGLVTLWLIGKPNR
jgi:hypothetical protein